jgi:6-phosphogluconate dehydrogenase (decarboxylating)
MALLPDRAMFHDAVNVSEMRKHAPAIKEFLINSTKSMMSESEEDLSRFCGWVLDNTKANWKAMLSMEQDYPTWIMRGCFAHGLALLVKDFAQPKVGRGAAEKRTGMIWAQRTLARSNTISNYVQDCGGAKSEVKF